MTNPADRESGFTVEALADILAESMLQNERGAAITGAALLEHLLARAIEAKWPPISNGIRADIFEKDGPLATFSAKILVGYAMGLYGPDLKSDLDRVRRVRNLFAHTMHPVTFKTERVKTLCNQF